MSIHAGNTHNSTKSFKPAKRRKARQLTLQALYQWQVSKTPFDSMVLQFYQNNDLEKIDTEYFNKLLKGITQNYIELDNLLEPLLDRPIEQLDLIEHASLWVGCYELLYFKEIPYKVVINESIELAKRFGTQDSHRYINGILDKLVSQVRHLEN